ncbi:MAG TPA: DHH family phosphoesterase [Longilinea sp.]|nr:DHH family phosphoesterase [Longilinea sp.]
MGSSLHEQIKALLHDAPRVLVVSHIRPDGDAVGSLLGMGLALKAQGKEVQMVLSDGIPSVFRHLSGTDLVRHHVHSEYDLSVVLDCSDIQRTGEVLQGRQPDLNIDHHITNLNFAQVNFVIPEAVATSAILAEFMETWGLVITEDIAKVLLSGIVSDTIGFRTPNVTPHTMRLAADLMEHGPNLSDLYTRALIRRSYEAARYWGYGLLNLKREGRLAWAVLTLKNREEAGYPGKDDADLINVISSLDGVDISVLFIEQHQGKVKVSWRGQPGYDVSQLALSFGGGGHPAAAGAEVEGLLSDVEEKVLTATKTVLDNNHQKE